MSFSANNSYSYTTEKGIVKTTIAEVTTGIKSLLNYSSRTRFVKYTTSNTWTVLGLKSFGKETTSIESPPITHQNSSRWSMVLTKNSDGLHVSFLLKHCATEMQLNSFLNAHEIHPNGSKREVFPSTWYSLKQGQQSKMLLVRKSGTDTEDDNKDEVTLKCAITMWCIVQDELPVADVAEPQVAIVSSLDDMLHKEVHTDFELRSGGTVLKAHRGLLCVRSPYFAAMLEPHTKEAQEGFVEASDVKPEVLKRVLSYIYTGVAPGLKDMPWKLLVAADKYQLLQLKRQCETQIAICLDVDNAAETAVNASLYSCDLLWDRAVLFIKRNLCHVMRTPGWTRAIATHPEAIQRISELME